MKLEILNNVFLKDRYLLMELSMPASFRAAAPGQFLHIRIEDSCDPLLRRPLSIHDIDDSRRNKRPAVKLLYEIVGKGTALLSQKKPFSQVDAIGPLGRGFDLKSIASYQKVYLVAGGMGVAPLFFLAKKIIRQKPIVLVGAKTKNHILCEREFKALGCEVRIATEDGSRGFKGRVTDLLKEILSSTDNDQLSTLCACGPKAMLAVISGIAPVYHLHAQVSLEEFMGCGLGACLGCVIRTTSGYKRICHDGPVFNARDIIWKE